MNLKEAKQALDLAQKIYNQLSDEEARKKRAAEDKIYDRRREEEYRCASDYASFGGGGFSFYYGYEETDYHPLLADCSDEEDEEQDESKKTWAFVFSKKDGKDWKEVYRRAIIPAHVHWNCSEGLIAGIGYYLDDKARLHEKI